MLTISPFDSALYHRLLSDQEAGCYLGDQAQIRAMLEVEAQLALAQADCGLIPQDAALAIAQAAAEIKIDAATLATDTGSAGVAVPALVQALKQNLPKEYARWVHFGATSQDIVDTALVLNCRELLKLYETRLSQVIEQLRELANTHRDTIIAGRTRTQQAVPMSFGLKVANWLAPLLRQQARLNELKPRLLKLQLAGAVGTLSAMQDQAVAISEKLAVRLDLAVSHNWHTQRDSVVELANWLALTTGLLGKMGQDWLLLGQTEVGELSFSNGGGSSTMPQKCNPVSAELLVTLARHNAGQIGQMHQAMLHEHERSGSGWTLEWLVLPTMLMATAVALHHSSDALAHIIVNTEKMQSNLGLYNGVIYAEAATFALAESMPRDQASALVKDACLQALSGERHLLDLIKEHSGIELDLAQLQKRLLAGGATQAWLDDILQAACKTAI
ncbi:MAG TPA: 3-carboxy-cis,cis-muconate cycloisomerase [Thiopseudomonas sp.]|nr:3-carboxy-cis,cis-muconate cycloisomerase [Thiopseudomonas sp.]